MWKIYIYPFWYSALVERYLEKMERDGFRLEKVYWGHLFKFKKASPRSVLFAYSRSFIKENEMHLYEYEIRQMYNAAAIPSIGLSEIAFHRICIQNADLTSFTVKRNKYMEKLILKRIVFIAMYLIGSICASISYGCAKIPVGLFMLVLFLLIILIYHIIGYAICKKQGKKTRDKTGDGSVS